MTAHFGPKGGGDGLLEVVGLKCCDTHAPNYGPETGHLVGTLCPHFPIST
nr:MAG TPA: hypothetical protein [Caudoviricetes sp.]